MGIGIDNNNVKDLAVTVFDGTRYEPTEEDIQALSRNMLLLEHMGLQKLNKRLIEGGKKVWDTLAEHNFACDLIECLQPEYKINYEPVRLDNGVTLRKPPDFWIVKNGIEYWIQMKKLALSERENRQRNSVEKIKIMARDIKINKFFWLDLSENFCHNDIEPLFRYITEIASDSKEKEEYAYKVSDEIRVNVSFWTPNKAVFEHLTLGGSGNLDMVNVTGEDSTQIKGSLSKATASIEWDTTEKTINLIVMEADNHKNIDISEALFGQEVFVHGMNGQRSWHRGEGGFFYNSELSKKIAGVVAIRRKERNPVSKYTKTLFINDMYVDEIGRIRDLIQFDRMIIYKDLVED